MEAERHEAYLSLAALFAPPEKITVSEWADENRVLTRESSAQTGQWKTRPYQRGPMDAFTDSKVHTIVLMVARQTLKTEVINNCIGFAIDRDPGPILVVQFRDTDCMKWSKIRLTPMLRATPCLRDKVSTEKSRSGNNTVEYKAFPGGHLSVVASASPGNLAALPIRYLFCDEIDKYPASAGASGDPISLAQGRQEEFWNRKTVLACTPTIANFSRIEKAWLESDQQEYEIRCPLCGAYQVPRWAQVKFGEGVSRRQRAEGARYHCAECDGALDDAARWRASFAGRYRATAEFNGVAGFRVNGLARIGTKLSELVDQWLKSEGHLEARKTFINEQLAETWQEPGEQLEWRVLSDRREPYAIGVVPAGGRFLTAGVDVQREDGGRLEVEVVAFGENRETWSVANRTFYGDPTQPEVWKKLETFRSEAFPHELGGELPIERMFVDSGDGTVTPFVYDWVQRQPRPQVWAIKGDRRSEQPVGPPKAAESTLRGRKRDHGIVFRLVNVDFFKAQLYADLKKRGPTDEERAKGMGYPQGYCHFPIGEEYSDEYFKQVCSEQLVRRKNRKGRVVAEWEPTRTRNEGLDKRIYAMAGAWDYGAHRFQEKHWRMMKAKASTKPMAEENPAPPAPRPRNDWFGGRTENWFRR